MAAAVALAATVQAADSVYTPTLKQVSMYGQGYVDGEMDASEMDGALKFVFNGEPIENVNQKAIQFYCKVWDLEPGTYNLTVQLKPGGDPLQVPMNLNGTKDDDPKTFITLAEFKAPKIGAEWTTVTLPVTVAEKMLHGYFIMRVGEVPQGTELFLKPVFTLSASERFFAKS